MLIEKSKMDFIGTDTPKCPFSSRNKKNRVVAALQPLFEQGKYFIHPDHIELREELLTIGSSRWDDLVDCAAYAEQILTPNYYPVPRDQEHIEHIYKREQEDRIDFAYGI